MAKAARTMPAPAKILNLAGTLKVHSTIPIFRINTAVSGLIRKLHTVMPITVEMMAAGIKDRAVCRIS